LLGCDDAQLGPERVDAWLLGPRPPEVLVIGVGWEEAARLAVEFRPPEGTRIITVGSGEAISTYNALKARGTRVAIHLHSTC
jgi:hypothetical protein